jgi:hemerythrin superfamily protein
MAPLFSRTVDETSRAFLEIQRREKAMPLGLGTGQSKQAKARAKGAAKGQDAIKLLKADHEEVTRLFEQYEKAKEKDEQKKSDLIDQICTALTVHAQIEEEIFYPAARNALEEKGEDLLDEAEVEHGTIKALVEQLENTRPDDELCDAKVKVLSEYVKHHVKEEEGEIFPKMKKSDADLDSLGAELAERKKELMEEM